MAITKESDILDLKEVEKSIGYLVEAAKQLACAIMDLEIAKEKCGTDILMINGKNTFPNQIDEIIVELNDLRKKLHDQKYKIYVSADDIISDEKQELADYKEATQKEGL